MPKVAFISGFPFYTAIFPFSSTHLPFFLVPAFVFPLENCVVRAAATSFRLDCSSGLLPIPLDPKRERAQSRERESQREKGRQTESESKRLRAHASNFLCLRTVPEMIWVSFESKLTYALDQNRSMQPACSPSTRSLPKPGTKKDTKPTRKSMKIPFYYPKQTKKVDKARPSRVVWGISKFKGIRCFLYYLRFSYVVLTVIKVLAGVISEHVSKLSLSIKPS